MVELKKPPTDAELMETYRHAFEDVHHAHITYEEYKKMSLGKTFTIRSLKYPIRVVKGEIQSGG